MCYLIAKDRDAHGCYALKTNHGRHLVELKRELNRAVGYKGVQLVTISRPSVVGFELSDEASGATIAEAEMAWEDKKIAWLLPEQEDYMDVFKDKGWTVLLSSEEININVFGGTVNE